MPKSAPHVAFATALSVAALIAWAQGPAASRPAQPERSQSESSQSERSQAERSEAERSQSERWGKEYLPNVPVIDHNGRPLKFYDDVIKGKIVVISFVYTSCKNICPLIVARLAEVQSMLSEDVAREVLFVSISIDPIPDTPPKLKAYADAFHITSNWLFLTGTPDDIDLIRHKLGERSGGVIVQHRNEVLLYNDKTSEWARDSGFSDHTTLVANIRAMNPQWRMAATAQTPPAAHAGNHAGAMPPVDLHVKGQALFIKGCAGCHTIGHGDKVGPDLKGVVARRGRDWVSSYVTGPNKLRAANDPAAVELGLKYPTVRMPDLGLAETDADDIISYLQRPALAAAPAAPPPHAVP